MELRLEIFPGYFALQVACQRAVLETERIHAFVRKSARVQPPRFRYHALPETRLQSSGDAFATRFGV